MKTVVGKNTFEAMTKIHGFDFVDRNFLIAQTQPEPNKLPKKITQPYPNHLPLVRRKTKK